MKLVVLDLETTGLKWYSDKIHGIGIAYSETNAKYYFSKDGYPKVLLDTLRDPSVAKVGQNIRFDLKFLKFAGIEVNGPIYCTRQMAQLLDENQSAGLKDLTERIFGKENLSNKSELDSAIGKAKVKHVGELCTLDLSTRLGDFTEIIAKYCIEDTINTWKLFFHLGAKLKEKNEKVKAYFKASKGPLDYYLEESMPTELVLRDIECQGVPVNYDALQTWKEKLEKESEHIKGQIFQAAAEHIPALEASKVQRAVEKRINEGRKSLELTTAERLKTKWLPTSNKDVADLLFGVLKVPGEKTGKGNWKCDEGVLSAVAEGVSGTAQSVARLLLSLRTVEKLRGTYAEGFLERAYRGRMYPGYPAHTVTGRLSSEEPNFQNMPRGCEVKRALVPSAPDKCFVYCDYSQVELRIAAHLSQDPQMMEQFTLGLDPHRATAASIFSIPESEVTDKQRQVGKTVNFLLIFDGGPMRLQEQLKQDTGMEFSIEECKAFKEAYFDKYPVYRKHLIDLLNSSIRAGAVLSEAGRLRTVPDLVFGKFIDSRNRRWVGPPRLEAQLKGVEGRDYYDKASKLYSHGKKQCFNFPVQSLGATITKRALIELAKKGFKIVTTVHDSIIVEVPRQYAQMEAHHIVEIMESAYKLSVPLKVDCKILNSFDEKDVFSF